MQERREYSRVIFKREVFVTLSDGDTLFTMAQDFSMYGIRILTDTPLELGSILSVEFNILSQDDSREINLRGTVVYSKPEQDQFINGISFSQF